MTRVPRHSVIANTLLSPLHITSLSHPNISPLAQPPKCCPRDSALVARKLLRFHGNDATELMPSQRSTEHSGLARQTQKANV